MSACFFFGNLLNIEYNNFRGQQIKTVFFWELASFELKSSRVCFSVCRTMDNECSPGHSSRNHSEGRAQEWCESWIFSGQEWVVSGAFFRKHSRVMSSPCMMLLNQGLKLLQEIYSYCDFKYFLWKILTCDKYTRQSTAP